MTAHALMRPDATLPTRFGFIASKRVGIAVERNRIRRRMKAISAELVEQIGPGMDVVVRLQPEAASLSFASLRESAHRAIPRAVNRARNEGRVAAPQASNPRAAGTDRENRHAEENRR